MQSVNLPDWFDFDRYEIEPASEAHFNEAALAVLDRLELYQIVATPSFHLDNMGEKAIKALHALQSWSENPYRRVPEVLSHALQPSLTLTSDEVKPFEDILDQEDKAGREEQQKWLHGVVNSVEYLPAHQQNEAVVKEIEAKTEAQRLEPLAPSWVAKLFERRIAAYLDLVLWLALTGRDPDIKTLRCAHNDLWPDGDDWRSVEGWLDKLLVGLNGEVTEDQLSKLLQGGELLRLRASINASDAFFAWRKNLNQRMKKN